MVGGDILYGAGPIPRAWHYVYRNDLREELHLKHTLPVIAAADHGVVAAFDRVVMDFKFHGFNPELCGEWTRIKASS